MNPPSSMTSLVTGATGYTGRHVIEQLCSLQRPTIAHIRPGSSSLETCRPQFESQGADVKVCPWTIEDFEALLSDVRPDHLYYLVGTTRERDRQSDEDLSYQAIDYGLLEIIVQASFRVGLRPRLIYLSAMGVKESARTAYYRARWRAEELVRGSDLPYIIARPGMITGPDRPESRPMERLGGWLANGVGAALNVVGASTLSRRYRATDGRELATALVHWAAHPNPPKILEAEDLKYPALTDLDSPPPLDDP